MADVLDVPTAVIMALLVLVDGLHRVPAGAMVVRSVLGQAWKVVAVERERPRLRLVSWWSPVSTTLVLASHAEATSEQSASFHERAAAVGDLVWSLRLLGAASLLGLLVGLPVAARRLSGGGFVEVLVLVCALAGAAALILARGYRRLGYPARGALHALSPFTAPRASEILLQLAAQGRRQLAVARELLAPRDFATFVRARVYDARVGRQADGELDALLSLNEQMAILARPETGEGEAAVAYCPRCGCTFRIAAVECGDCGVPVQLLTRG